MTTWDDFKIKTTPKCPRGVIYMHPDDAAVMRPMTLDAVVRLVGAKRHVPQPDPDAYRGHRDRDDEAARERIRKQFAELARRAAGVNKG